MHFRCVLHCLTYLFLVLMFVLDIALNAARQILLFS